jgi:hypothetical protein
MTRYIRKGEYVPALKPQQVDKFLREAFKKGIHTEDVDHELLHNTLYFYGAKYIAAKTKFDSMNP